MPPTTRSATAARATTPSAPLYTALLNDGTAFKHWALFLDTPTPNPHSAPKLLLNALGSSESAHGFRYECVVVTPANNPRNNPALHQLVYLCEVGVGDVERVREVAGSVRIRNDVRGWNCQDFVLEVLGGLEGVGVIEGGEGGYMGRKEGLEGMVEGLG
ncbi:hypothetical protein FQN51_001917 [Onygenales sp. PD_10]|nr:hypothetical protein FQN51_001917 [Onygenales sp. PD_10]